MSVPAVHPAIVAGLSRIRLIMQTPAIRARQADDQHATRMLVVEALAVAGLDGPTFALEVLAAAALSALTTALTAWSDGDGAASLVGLVDEAFSILRRSGASDGAPAVPGEPR